MRSYKARGVVQIHDALLWINRIVEVQHTRNVLAQVRFLVDALEPTGSRLRMGSRIVH